MKNIIVLIFCLYFVNTYANHDYINLCDFHAITAESPCDFSTVADERKLLDSISKRGDLEGNGGDPALGLFLSDARILFTDLLSNDFSDSIVGNLDRKNLRILYNKTYYLNLKCGNSDDFFLNGSWVVAINYPNERPQRIMLDCRAFENIEKKQRNLLILHELLPLIGIDDSNWSISSELLGMYKSHD